MITRHDAVALAESWVGLNEKDGSYKKIIDIYNSFTGCLPRNIQMDYSWPWCACTWSALAIQLKSTDTMPIEISCGYLIEAAKKKGCWNETDGYVPSPGDAVLYDWDDNGIGDNTGWPDHIGIVSFCEPSSGYFVVIEGNYNHSVKKRTMSINGKFIRGFITPKYFPEESSVPTQAIGEDIDQVVREVIIGVWGNMPERKENLEKAGYNYEEIRKRVNAVLNGDLEPGKNTTSSQEITNTVGATCKAQYYDPNISGCYRTTANLYCRNDAGTNKKAMCLIPKDTEVRCYGYYNKFGNQRWLYIAVVMDGIRYIGFSCEQYLEFLKL